MNRRISLSEWIVRYKTHLNIAGVIACALWIGWITWMTWPDAAAAPPAAGSACVRPTT
ncbi:conserved protein of unknown function [Burkholderia multivorans]